MQHAPLTRDLSFRRLEAAEREISGQRRVLHQRLDAIQAEMARRYRDGEADVDALLADTNET